MSSMAQGKLVNYVQQKSGMPYWNTQITRASYCEVIQDAGDRILEVEYYYYPVSDNT